MGGLFLTISPGLRGTVLGGLESATLKMEYYAPFSYIGAVILLLLTLMVVMYRGAQPR
jgi:hypothetical protein